MVAHGLEVAAAALLGVVAVDQHEVEGAALCDELPERLGTAVDRYEVDLGAPAAVLRDQAGGRPEVHGDGGADPVEAPHQLRGDRERAAVLHDDLEVGGPAA